MPTWDRHAYHLMFGTDYPATLVLVDGTILTVSGAGLQTTQGKARTSQNLWTTVAVRCKLPPATGRQGHRITAETAQQHLTSIRSSCVVPPCGFRVIHDRQFDRQHHGGCSGCLNAADADRLHFSTSRVKSQIPCPCPGSIRAKTMKITDVKAYAVVPTGQLFREIANDTQWTFVTVDTDEGLQGWGEASNTPRNASLLTAAGIGAVREALIGQDPARIEQLWHRLFRRYTYMGSRGFASTVLSGIDIALWDLRGKALGVPVYQLLGGAVRDNVPVYANGWFSGCEKARQFADAAAATVAAGHDAIKLDPFLEMVPCHTAYLDGQISAEGEQAGYNIIAAIRQAVGDNVQILIDAHGHYNVPTAVRLANRLYDQSQITWFEEPVPPESFSALRQTRSQIRAAICVGERLFTRFDFAPLLAQRLADYIMPDVVWTGGISELKKIATMAEAHYLPISPHNAQGPGQILAGAHVSMSVPNFYRLEHALSCKASYDRFLQVPLKWEGNRFHLEDRPGLGVDLDMEQVKAMLHPAWMSR